MGAQPKYLLIIGDLIEGFKFFGPYETAELAVQDGDENIAAVWTVVPVHPAPERYQPPPEARAEVGHHRLAAMRELDAEAAARNAEGSG